MPHHTQPGIYKSWLAEKQLRQDTPVLRHLKTVDNQRGNADNYAVLFHLHQSMDAHILFLHHRTPSHFSQETCSAFSSWSKGFTYSRKRTRYALREPVVDVQPVGKNLQYVLSLYSVESVHYSFGTIDSDIVHVNSLGTHVIVLNSAKAVHELFEKRSSIYSDRYGT
jgi:hypothetical protein